MRIDFVSATGMAINKEEYLKETWYDCDFIPKIEDIVFVGGKYYQVFRLIWLGKDHIICTLGSSEYTRMLK